MLLFMAALIFLAIFAKKNRKLQYVWMHYSYFVLFIMLFPVTAIIIMDYCIGEEVYWRMFWILPIPFVIAIAAVEVSNIRVARIKQIVVRLLLLGIICFSGKYVYDEDTIVQAQNMEKLPDEAEEVCNMISADALENQVGQKKAVVPAELLSYIRQYDATIQMPYGRNAIKEEYLPDNCQKIYDLMQEEKKDYFSLSGLLKEEVCNYLVLDKSDASSKMDKYGYYQVAQTDKYVIFRCDDFE